tara:strand:- start:165 stop:1862 length:1698 start_codon:yes stop_codon:yes gene_type:complete
MKYLKFLTFFFIVSLLGCTSDHDANSNKTSAVSAKNFDNPKYQRLFNSIYLRIALHKNKQTEALDLFLRDIEDTKDIKLFSTMSKLAISRYQYEDALVISRYWNKLDKSPESLKFGLISSLENGDFSSAENFYSDYFALTQSLSKIDYSRLFFYLTENKNRLNVINFLQKELESNYSRDMAISYIELIYSYNMSNEVINLINKIQTYNDRNLVRLLASSYLQVDDPLSAEQVLKSYLEGKKLIDKQVSLELLESFLDQKKIIEAKPLIQSIVDISPSDPDILFEISSLLFDYGYYDLSEKYLSVIVVNDDRIKYLRGLLYLEKKNYVESVYHFERIEDYALRIPAHINIATSLDKLNGSDKALKYLDNIRDTLKIKTDQVRILMKSISILRAEKKFNEIVNITSEYLDDNPRDISVMYSRAMAYESLKMIGNMEADLLKILSIDSKNTNTLNALGYSLTIHTDRYDDASYYVSEAYSHDPGNAAIIDSMSWVLYKKGDYSQALKYSTVAFMKDKDPEIVEHHCIILLKNSLFDEYEKIIETVISSDNYDSGFIEKLRSLKKDESI